MEIKEFLESLNLFKICKRYNLPLWQCPQTLFLLMGILIIGAILLTYFLGTRYINQIEWLILIILAITAFLFVVAFVIVNSFERLAQANRLKSEFISIASHQLRSPFSNLKWAIEYLMLGKAGKIENTQMEYLKILKENCQRIGELISDLLIISKIESFGLEPEREKFSLKDLTEKLIKEYTPFAKASNVKIEFEVEKEIPEIFSDPSKVKLVIENLLENAIRYNKPGGKVKIKILKKKKDVYFEIKDTGIGIPKKVQKYIFQKFFRGENAKKCQPQGSGLGLYICKEIIKNLKGKMGFQSEENKGSVFWFTLPKK